MTATPRITALLAALAFAGCGDKEPESDKAPTATRPAPEAVETPPPAGSARKILGVGSAAPTFALEAHDGRTIDLARLTGPVVLYFYPKDDTPG